MTNDGAKQPPEPELGITRASHDILWPMPSTVACEAPGQHGTLTRAEMLLIQPLWPRFMPLAQIMPIEGGRGDGDPFRGKKAWRVHGAWIPRPARPGRNRFAPPALRADRNGRLDQPLTLRDATPALAGARGVRAARGLGRDPGHGRDADDQETRWSAEKYADGALPVRQRAGDRRPAAHRGPGWTARRGPRRLLATGPWSWTAARFMETPSDAAGAPAPARGGLLQPARTIGG